MRESIDRQPVGDRGRGVTRLRPAEAMLRSESLSPREGFSRQLLSKYPYLAFFTAIPLRRRGPPLAQLAFSRPASAAPWPRRSRSLALLGRLTPHPSCFAGRASESRRRRCCYVPARSPLCAWSTPKFIIISVAWPRNRAPWRF